jgi:putative signal transducing protein
MNNKVTVAVFNNMLELSVFKGRLEAEGIACSIKNNLTFEYNPYNTLNMETIELEVPDTDSEKAINLLKAGGYKFDNPVDENNLLLKLNHFGEDVIILKDLSLSTRLTLLMVFITLLLTGIVYFVFFN